MFGLRSALEIISMDCKRSSPWTLGEGVCMCECVRAFGVAALRGENDCRYESMVALAGVP